MTNDQRMTKDQGSMTNSRAEDLHIGHCTLVIHWSLRHWSLVIYSQTKAQAPMTNGRAEDSGNWSLHIGHSLVIASLVIGHLFAAHSLQHGPHALHALYVAGGA